MMYKISDTLLSWMSEIETGTIANFRRRATWMAKTANESKHAVNPNKWLRNLSVLGHCEIDWRTSRWEIADAGITKLPFSDGLAILYGARRRQLLDAFDGAGIYTEQTHRVLEDSMELSPTTIYLPYSTDQELVDVANEFGLHYCSSAAEELLDKLPIIETLEPAAPPAADSVFEQFRFTDSVRWCQYSANNSSPEKGLYREQLYGRWRYLAYRANRWWAVDRDLGIFWMLSVLNRSVLQFNVQRGRNGMVGTLITKHGVSLPVEHERSLAFCSGLLPRSTRVPGTMLFENVPRRVAEILAECLGQNLQVREQS